MSESILVADGLSVGYPGRGVLREVSCRFGPGITALIGPNGSGKSTLLKTLGGLLPPISGTVRLHDKPIDQLSDPARAQQIAMVMQETPVAFGFTAEQVVMMGRAAWSSAFYPSQEDQKIVDDALEIMEIADLRNRSVLELSGGERQRVFIARAIAQRTPVLLLDEPLSHLDPPHQIQLARVLRRSAEHGTTIVMAVHELRWAVAVSDWLVLMSAAGVTEPISPQRAIETRAFDDLFQVTFSYSSDGPNIDLGAAAP